MTFLKKENKEHTEEVYKFLTEDTPRIRNPYERTNRKAVFQASENETKKSVANKDFNVNSFLLGWLVSTLGIITGQIIYNIFLK